MSHNTAYFTCEDHGYMYVLRDVTVNTPFKISDMESLKGYPIPNGFDRPVCPVCGKPWRIMFTD